MSLRYNNTVDGFKTFLAEFSTKPAPVDDFLPFRFLTRALTNEEIDGEIVDTAFTSVEEYHCPDALKYAIADEVLKQMKEEGYDKFCFQEEEKDWVKKGNEHRAFYYLPDVVKDAILRTYEIGRQWNENLPDIHVPKLVPYCVHGIKNTRRKMEDRHAVFPNLNDYLKLGDDVPHTQYYAVFDGHGGVEGSDFAAKQFHFRLAKHESFKTDLTDAIGKGIKALDEEYCEKCKRECLRSGSTAVVAGIRDNTLHLAWLGDSQAGLVKGGKFVPLMEPHKPEREDEKKRIEDLGGCVIWFGTWRVNGSLSVSRSIGDPDYKPLVSGDADTLTRRFDGDEEYLCLACDGFWDVLNGDQLVKLVSRHMRETNDRSTIAQMLCNKAKKARSNDNVTVIVVFLKDEITLVDDDLVDLSKPPVKEKEPEPEPAEEDDDDDNDEVQEGESKDDVQQEDSKNNKDGDDSKQQNDSVMVHGSKLQPTEKEQPPLKLFVNKPKTFNSNVNVLKTDSTPHARLPCSIASRKLLRTNNRAPSEKLESSVASVSLSTVHSNESTVALSLSSSENQLSVGSHQTRGFPAIFSNRDQRLSPSPSYMSEPECNQLVRLAGPPTRRRSAYRRANLAKVTTSRSIGGKRIVNDRWQKPALTRRASRSVPDRLDKLGNGRSSNFASISTLFHYKSESQTRLRRRTLDESQKENKIFLQNICGYGMLDTNFAITNYLPSNIKPKHDFEKRLISSYLRHPTGNDPILHARRW